MPEIMIPDTSLCAIVFDEIENPAGTIEQYVDSTMPFVEAGVIVDAGSIDGTRDRLEQLTEKYPNLQVFDYRFTNFADIRNFSLRLVKTKRALILDADERIEESDLAKLMEIMHNKDCQGYNFKFVQHGTRYSYPIEGHNPRLFDVSPGFYYRNMIRNFGEKLFENDALVAKIKSRTIDTDITIHHICPSAEAMERKKEELYVQLNSGIVVPPSMLSSYREWKKRNTRVDYNRS